MSLKKIFSLSILLILVIFTLSSCKNEDDIELIDWTTLKYEQKVEVEESNLLSPGKLIIATSPDFSPYEYKDLTQNGIKQFQGADIFLANFLAQTMGLELEISESSFDGLIVELNTDKADLVLAGLTYSEARNKNFTFTDVYYDSSTDEGGQILLVLTENVEKYDNLEILNNNDMVIGCQVASIQEELVMTQLPNATIQPINKVDEATQILLKGSIDAIAMPSTTAEALINSNDSFSIIPNFKFDSELYKGNRGLLAKNNPLVDDINEALTYLDEGVYQEWLDMNVDYLATIGITKSNFFVNIWNILKEYGVEFLKGTGITLALSAITVIFGTIIALLLYIIRSSRFLFFRSIGNVYVEFVRGIPLLLLLWLLYMACPGSWPSYISITIALFLNSGAYVAEIIRGGILAVDKGQYEAARTLGLSKMQTFKKIILPQATKKILPALGNEFVALIKETSLASVFFIGDLMTIKNNISSITYLSIEPFIIVGIIYFVLTFGTTKLIKHFELKMEA